jgi:hypothetical protein
VRFVEYRAGRQLELLVDDDLRDAPFAVRRSVRRSIELWRFFVRNVELLPLDWPTTVDLRSRP